jgi:hypothetical protein
MAKQITIKDDEEIVEIQIKKTGKVEISVKRDSGYILHHFHDKIYEGPCKVILIRKKHDADVINKNGDLVK